MSQCTYPGCGQAAMEKVPHCRNHVTAEDKMTLPGWKGVAPPQTVPFSQESSLSHQDGKLRKVAGETLVQATYKEFVEEMRCVAEEIIRANGQASTDDLHIWCEKNGHPIPVNQDGQKTAMTAVFKDRQRFEAIRDEAGELIQRQSKLTTNNARRLCIYKMNPNYRRTS
jgi:hypothetical protein